VLYSLVCTNEKKIKKKKISFTLEILDYYIRFAAGSTKKKKIECKMDCIGYQEYFVIVIKLIHIKFNNSQYDSFLTLVSN